MRIATWNVERLKHQKALAEIISLCDKVKADILVLTETDCQVSPDYRYCFSTPAIDEGRPVHYKQTENRVSIFTNYPCIRRYSTFDKYTSLCVELETEWGSLLVYGTIAGIYGNRHPSFALDLSSQVADIKRLSQEADGFCLCGDLNCSFADNYYFTQSGRKILMESFAQNDLVLLTEAQPECIDHIALTRGFGNQKKVRVEEWNQDKLLSDHKGIVVTV